jgi:hypothetical protein
MKKNPKGETIPPGLTGLHMESDPTGRDSNRKLPHIIQTQIDIPGTAVIPRNKLHHSNNYILGKKPDYVRSIRIELWLTQLHHG